MNELIQNLREINMSTYMILSAVVFIIGAVGVLIRRNAIIVFMCIEIMLNAVNLLLASFAAYRNDAAGQVFVFFIMVVAAAEVAVGLAMLVMIYRNSSSVNISMMSRMKR